jgi:hypothetical protein
MMNRTQQQTCKSCGRVACFNFHLPDWLWQKVLPKRLWNRVVCLCCFDSFARKKHVDYSRHLESLYFAGSQAMFEFRVTKALAI